MTWQGIVLAGLALSYAGPAGAAGGDEDGRFSVTDPVVCREIRGFEDYEVLPMAELTADDKLLLYFRPLHYKTVKVDDHYEARFAQDGKVRRKGEKTVVWTKTKLLEYTAKFTDPTRLVYLRNTIALKGLKPGEYEFEITLRDEIGQPAPAVKSVPFRIVAVKPAADDKK